MGAFTDCAQAVHDGATVRTGLEMTLDFGPLGRAERAVHELVQNVFVWMHDLQEERKGR